MVPYRDATSTQPTNLENWVDMTWLLRPMRCHLDSAHWPFMACSHGRHCDKNLIPIGPLSLYLFKKEKNSEIDVVTVLNITSTDGKGS